MPKISVIMPVFNAEQYVELALKTLLAQSFNDFEVIVIDDASTDRTLEIVEGVNDERIVIVKNETNLSNVRGMGAVRNIGLERATGDYIYFMDGTDAIMPNGLELLFNAADENEADAVISTKFFNFADVEAQALDENTQTVLKGKGGTGMVSEDLKERVKDGYCNWKLPAGVVFSFVRRQFLESDGIRFRDAAIHEDGIWLMEILCMTDRIFRLETPFYIVRPIKSSTTSTAAELSDTGEFAKRVNSFLVVMEYFDRVLARRLLRNYGTIDQYFVDTVCLSVKDRALVKPMRRFYKANPSRCWEIVRAEVDNHYGGYAPLIRKLLTGYFLAVMTSLNSEAEIKRLKTATIELKSTMVDLKNAVNKAIPF